MIRFLRKHHCTADGYNYEIFSNISNAEQNTTHTNMQCGDQLQSIDGIAMNELSKAKATAAFFSVSHPVVQSYQV
jgi:hypothetical protein